ncbi:quinone oxidoreductase family protein [Agromyces larvae]|uniref:Zinc-binding alcohol dehydrogenase family protein n=1 Tax=Agromyces larvae TaxID=2929802 RepID=A0ABY4BVM1_9MICO|nr:zinc-binding alcohol dehydrogenase family protein [Agromyces larvae]UOE43252.1 zinc-binding alcohol dehydrogenase family protein [Agromyces larvae]
MTHINAALVESFGEPPRYRSIPAPQADARREVAEVLAVGIHPVTRGVASGRHYASSGALPVVPGIDGVVRRADGSLAYVGGLGGGGTMAERILIDPRSAIPVPSGADPATVAASMNPAMSSWVALRGRVPFRAGQSVLVIGATGAAGSIAVKTARHLGAGRVVAAGRNRQRLEQLAADGADAIVELSPDDDATAAAFAAAAAEVDVVLDYVWGAPTELAMRAILGARTDHARLLDWVHIGSTAGPTITLDGSGLRSNALRISGSGFGSIDLRQAGLPELVAAVASGALTVRPRPVPLETIEQAWGHEDAPGERTVVIPTSA